MQCVKWISINDKQKPKLGQKVLVAINKRVLILTYVEYNIDKPSFIDSSGYELDGITHWMPLPNPPLKK